MAQGRGFPVAAFQGSWGFPPFLEGNPAPTGSPDPSPLPFLPTVRAVVSSFSPANPAKALQPVRLLSSRDQYATCHISLPGETQRLSAIAVGGRFYSFFRSCGEASKAIGLTLKLTGRGNEVAITPTNRGYALWVFEPDGVPAANVPGRPPRPLAVTAPPARCWMISDRQPEYRACNLRVPDLPDTVPGITNGVNHYSLYRREKDQDAALKLAARLTQRGDEVVFLSTLKGYILCIREVGASLMP